MQIGTFGLYQAEGVELTKRIPTTQGDFPVGHILTSEDIRILRNIGIHSVSGVLYSTKDVPAKTAGDVFVHSICGDYTRYTTISNEGCIDIFSDINGVLVYDKERLHRLNKVSDSVSLSLLPAYTPVFNGQYIGTLHIYSPAVDESVVNSITSGLSGMGILLSIKKYDLVKAVLVQVFDKKDEINKNAEDDTAIKKRFATFGFDIRNFEMCEGTVASIENAIRSAYATGITVVLIESRIPDMSLIKDKSDIIPKALIEASTDIDRMNWPFDEGSQIVLAHRKNTVFLGYNYPDFFKNSLRRLFCHVNTKTIPPMDLIPSMVMGSQALDNQYRAIKDLEKRRSVALGEIEKGDKTAVIILAAGRSGRMSENKLLLDVGGQTFITRIVEQALSSNAGYVIVVTGHQSNFIEKQLEQYDVKIVRNADYLSGILSSIRIGISVLPNDVNCVLVMPTDMPAFSFRQMNDMFRLFRETHDFKPVVVPSYAHVRSNPVLWPRELFDQIKVIPEDSYCIPTLIEHTDITVEYEIKDPLILSDINTRGDYETFLKNYDFKSKAEQDLMALMNENRIKKQNEAINAAINAAKAIPQTQQQNSTLQRSTKVPSNVASSPIPPITRAQPLQPPQEDIPEIPEIPPIPPLQ
ncbi:MAG: NTP transferase domain-containing protein [Alphaproteobacteria bacterium]|nr:NTP transferase domain-containing protein [Alphaproteobacteria bacterium]